MGPTKTDQRRSCVRPPHLDILWLPRAAMRSVEGDPSDCVLVVGVSRPKMAVAILTVMLVSLFLTFHMLYDSALHSFQASNVEHPRPPLLLLSRRLYPAAARRLPQAIIIGVRKCGTRALLEMLYLHPMVQKAAGEVHFFDRDENYNRGLEWYRMKMPHSYQGQITIEKSPSYFVTPEVPERIRAMNASVKLLLIVREPVTRAISDYTQLRTHAATAASTATPTAPPRAFEQLAMMSNGSINEQYRPLAISIYHNYVHRWLEVFPREQILVVNGDLLIEDPVPQLQKIERFLGLESRIGTHNFYFNETKGFYCLRNETSDRCLRESKVKNRNPHWTLLKNGTNFCAIVHEKVISKNDDIFCDNATVERHEKCDKNRNMADRVQISHRLLWWWCIETVLLFELTLKCCTKRSRNYLCKNRRCICAEILAESVN